MHEDVHTEAFVSNRFLKTLLFSAALVGLAGGTAFGATMNYVGTWVNSTTYRPGNVIVYNRGLYYALGSTLTAPNRNRNPGSNPTWWAQVGTIGNTILSGVVNPTSPDLGLVGDFYINTSTGTIFGPKSAISPFWPATGIAITGGAGGEGPAGPTGPAGEPGPRGPRVSQAFRANRVRRANPATSGLPEPRGPRARGSIR